MITCNLLSAYTYEHQMLQIHAKIAPRLILMSEFSKVEKPQDITIVIVYESGDENAATLLKRYLKESYPKGLNNQHLKIIKTKYSDFTTAPKHALLFLFDTDERVVKKILEYAKNNKLITMSYRDEYLDYGVHVSLHVGRSLKPYLNIHAAKENGMVFANTLITISKIFYPKEQP